MRKLILALMLSVLLLGFGTSQAATSALDNLPGGAVVTYWQIGSGWTTLFNVQNVASNAEAGVSAAMLLHTVVYDHNSNKIVSFNIPVSASDNWGASIILDAANNIVITPENCPATLPNGGGASAGCGVILGAATPIGGIASGYMTTIITALDTVAPPAAMTSMAAGNGNGNPWDDVITTQTNYVAPNWILGRAAIINTTSGVAFATNGKSIQNFHNIDRIVEAPVAAPFLWVNTQAIPDVYCFAVGIDWNNDADLLDTFIGNDEINGAALDTWELYASLVLDSRPVGGGGLNNVSDSIIVDGCTRAGRYRAFGSANGWYWARYNVTPGISDTTLVMIAPASTGTGHVGAAPLTITGLAWSDNEDNVDVTLTPIEVARCPYLSLTNPGGTQCSAGLPNSLGHNVFTTGEHNLSTAAPMYGFSYTMAGNFADVYPIVQEGANIVLPNIQPWGAPLRAIFAGQGAPLAVVVETAPTDSAVGPISAFR